MLLLTLVERKGLAISVLDWRIESKSSSSSKYFSDLPCQLCIFSSFINCLCGVSGITDLVTVGVGEPGSYKSSNGLFLILVGDFNMFKLDINLVFPPLLGLRKKLSVSSSSLSNFNPSFNSNNVSNFKVTGLSLLLVLILHFLPEPTVEGVGKKKLLSLTWLAWEPFGPGVVVNMLSMFLFLWSLGDFCGVKSGVTGARLVLEDLDEAAFK